MISGMRAGVAKARALPVLLTLTLAACAPSPATQAPETPTSPPGTPPPPPTEVPRSSLAGRERAEVEVANLRALATIDGRLAVVGTVINRSARPIEVSQLAILAADEDGISLALASSSAPRARLEPGAEGPFLAILPAG